MNYLQSISQRNGGAFILLTPDDYKSIDNCIDRAIKSAYEQGLAAAKAISQITKEKPLKSRYSYKEVKEMFGICDGTIRNWGRAGIIKLEAVGNKHYVTGDSIQQIQILTNQKAYSRV